MLYNGGESKEPPKKQKTRSRAASRKPRIRAAEYAAERREDMELNFTAYLDKVRACFLGKNVGGTLGTPFEGKRGVFDVTFYTHDTSKGVLPNDDLDLQLVWLLAAEKYGPAVNAQILSEYWVYKIVAHWAEYGQGKVNVRAGLLPPLSGAYNNYMKDSDGCFIRSEIWACLCPGRPDLAVKYAYEDAIVDHADEGLYGEIFTAALESAAFAESDPEKLIDIALSYIPEESAVAGAVRLVQQCKKDGLTWRQARVELLTKYAGSFAAHNVLPCAKEDEVPTGPIGFDAPSNIGIAMIGWYYGEGDFGKSLCTAVNCGEDGDCTAATLGSIWGIIHGTEGIPRKWLDPIGDEIKTISLDLTHDAGKICKSVSELTQRIANLMPAFMSRSVDLTADGVKIHMREGADLFDTGYRYGIVRHRCFKDELRLKNPMTTTFKTPFYNLYIGYENGIEITEGKETSIKLTVRTKFRQAWLTMSLLAPEGWEFSPAREMSVTADYGYQNYGEFVFRFTPRDLTKGRYEFPLAVKLDEVGATRYYPIVLLVR